MATPMQLSLKKLAEIINKAIGHDVEAIPQTSAIVVHGPEIGRLTLRCHGYVAPGHCWTCGELTLGDNNYCVQHDPEKT